jgi:quinol monooxygenase YgiN
MIILAGTFRIAAGRKVDALPTMQAMIAASRAEPGCSAYAFSFDAIDDHLVHVFEVFADETALATHRRSAHMQTWRSSWEALGIGERNMMRYDGARGTQI